MSDKEMLEYRLERYYDAESVAEEYYPEVFKSLAFQEQLLLKDSAENAMIWLLEQSIGDDDEDL